MHNYHANTHSATRTHTHTHSALEYSHSHSQRTHCTWPMNITSIRVFSEIENRFESVRIICSLLLLLLLPPPASTNSKHSKRPFTDASDGDCEGGCKGLLFCHSFSALLYYKILIALLALESGGSSNRRCCCCCCWGCSYIRSLSIRDVYDGSRTAKESRKWQERGGKWKTQN